jgi:hypothetical protein
MLLACGFLLSWVLAGCAQSNPEALPDYRPGGAAAPVLAPAANADGTRQPSLGQLTSGRLATPPPGVTYRPADPWGTGAWVERGRIQATTSDQRAAVQAVLGYLSQRVRLSNTWQVDEPGLAAVAAQEAVTTARERAARQRAQGLRSVGRFVVNVSSVQVTGSTAAVSGCHFDATAEVDGNGTIVIPPPGGVQITMRVQRTSGTWRVVDWPDRKAPSCDWRVS